MESQMTKGNDRFGSVAVIQEFSTLVAAFSQGRTSITAADNHNDTGGSAALARLYHTEGRQYAHYTHKHYQESQYCRYSIEQPYWFSIPAPHKNSEQGRIDERLREAQQVKLEWKVCVYQSFERADRSGECQQVTEPKGKSPEL